MPAASTIVHELVPCAFAKPHKGKPGVHKVTVVLDANGGVSHLGCECQVLHGENAKAIYELEEGNSVIDTCFATLAEVRRTVRDLEEPSNKLPESLQEILQRTSTLRNDRREKRTRLTYQLSPREQKLQALTRVANKVANAVLKLPAVYNVGRFATRVQNQVKHERVYAPIVSIIPSLNDSVTTALYLLGDHLVMHGVPGGSSWELSKVDEDLLRNNVKHIYTLGGSDSYSRLADIGPLHKGGPHSCIFCGETFDRPSRHTAGAAHADRVINLVKLVLRATSRLGLQMLNNPRHRTAFIKD